MYVVHTCMHIHIQACVYTFVPYMRVSMDVDV